MVLAVVAGAVVWSSSGSAAPPVTTRDATVDVLDGPARDQRVQLSTRLYLPENTPAPAVLLAHGFGGSRDTVAEQARELAQRGFVVLTYSARGFGLSTGKIALNAPDYEVYDAQKLLDYLARQPEVITDGPDDPRVGVTGASYGGALALMLAGTDKRVDAIAPVITYNDLSQALLPNAATTGQTARTPAAGAFSGDGVFKRSWAGLLFSAGAGPRGAGAPGGGAANPGATQQPTQPPTDQPSDQPTQPPSEQPTGASGDQGGQPPAGDATGGPVSCGNFTDEICRAYVEVATTGRASQQTMDLLHSVSPVSVAEHITAPTLLVQGEQDTLFGLDQADATARQISQAGGTVKVIWYPGGHDADSPGPDLRATIGDWLATHLGLPRTSTLDTAAVTTAGFEYSIQGPLRTQRAPTVRTVAAPTYPGLGTESPGTQRQSLALAGNPQPVLRPPGGSPTSISAIPGLGTQTATSSQLANRLALDMPGQTAQFTTEPVTEQILVAGAPTVRLRISSPAGQQGADEAVLFAKLYDVAADGSRTLPGSAVAPLRVTGLPADGSPVEVTVTLPGIVRPVAAGHRLQLVVTTTDLAYATPVQPATHVVALAGDQGLALPVVPGRTVTADSLPTGALWGIGVVLAVCLVLGLVSLVRRRHPEDVAEDLTGVPLVIDGLTKSYPGGLTAVRDLSFRVERGQVLGLLGPNGAGKTTTLRMLMGLVRPTEGSIRVFGHQVSPGAPVLSRIGSFVEGAGFLPHLSGAANLRLYWAATGRPEEQAHFDEALEIAGLGSAVYRKVRTYSQGMRQRLAIAQAMLGLPDLLVLDEPANGLDPPQIHQMRAVLRRYAATGRTVLVSSHLLAEVEQTCSHVVVMHRGQLVAAGPVGEIVADGGEVSFRVDDAETAARVLRELPGVTKVTVAGPDQVHAELDAVPRATAVASLVRADVAVEQVSPRRRLEDVFLELVGEGAAR
ncbi:ABC-2 type transport system ATP-binding protein [Goodfellowiella coeruleoviolacea]|uniref:ABC-2 type transport system ATP-binding protein n=1 Tax=Goodfellowiella coeruleoviolacea TaxID=334858 RepID=A0AAE3GKV6_9PSEU|nr:ABC-2 type transport system ATP-binding protein [Goodfellowiella coeruleoviolacea]